MNDAQILNVFDIVSFIVGISSIVIAITSLILSILFYQWGKKENESTTNNVIRIEEKISFLDKLFDQLYSKAFDAVKSHGDEMQKMLRESIGSISGSTQKSFDLEFYLYISKPGKYTVKEIAQRIGLNISQTTLMIEAAVKDPRYGNLGLSFNNEVLTCTPVVSDMNLDQSDNL